MVTEFLRWEIFISTLVCQAQLKQSCYQRAFQEPYNGNCQQLHLVPYFIQKVTWNVRHDWHRLMQIRKSFLHSIGRSKQASWSWLHKFLLPQSCWMYWVPHATACVQGIYIICSSKGIQWSWGMYLLRGEIKWLVVEWTGTVVEYHHTHVDSDPFNSYGGHLDIQFSLHLAFQTEHILSTIRAKTTNR